MRQRADGQKYEMGTQLLFDRFRLDVDKPALMRDGNAVSIAAQPLRLLVLLASRGGDVVSHNEICDHLWDGRVVDFTNGLHVCIRQIRVALDDNSSLPRFVQNVPRKGYRFVSDVSRVPETTSQNRPFARAATIVALLLLGLASLTDNSNSDARREAIDAYRRGLHVLESGKPEGVERSRSFFRNAIDADPNYAPAHVAMAETYELEGSFDLARPYALQAVALDEYLADAHLRLAAVFGLGDWNWAQAEDSARTALALEPQSAEAYHAVATVYSVTGRSELALDKMRTAMDLDPASTLLTADFGMYLYYLGDMENARQQCEDALAIDPSHYPSKLCVYKVAVHSGNYVEASGHANDIVARWAPSGASTVGNDFAPTPAGVQNFERWRLDYYSNIDIKEKVSPVAYALVHAALGESELTLKYLEQSVQTRETMTPFVLADPVFDIVRDDARFQHLLHVTNVLIQDPKG